MRLLIRLLITLTMYNKWRKKMNTFSVNSKMTVAINKINYVRYYTHPGHEIDGIPQAFVQVSFGTNNFEIAYTNEEEAKDVYDQICGLLVAEGK